MKNNNKGAFTLEAAIVMTAVLMILFAVMYAFMLLYQNAVLNYAATYAAQQGAEFWNDSGKDLNTGVGHANDDGLYFRIRELNPSDQLVAAKKGKIEEAARDKLTKGILSPRNTTVVVEFEDNLLQRTVTVDIAQQIPFPFMGIARYFGNGGGLVLKARAKSTVAEPAEYIRNIDLAMEYVQKFTKVVSVKMLKGFK